MKDRNKAIPASHLVLRDGSKILLIRRFNTGYADGQYSLPAGHVDGGELPIDAIIREAKEEIGIEVQKGDLTFTHCLYMSQWDTTGDRLQFFFEATVWNGDVKNMEPHKCDEIRWCEISELPDTMIPYIKNGVLLGEKGIFYSEM